MKKFAIKFISLMLIATCMFSGCTGGKEEHKGNSDNENVAVGVETPRLVMGAKEVTLYIGETYTLKYALKNTEGVASFISNDETVATVTESGVITAMGVGTAIITVRAGTLNKKCTVTVNPAPTYNLRCADTEVSLVVGSEYTVYGSLYKGAQKIASDISFHSNNEEIATVNDLGLITACGVGECDVILTTIYEEKSYYDSVKIKVKESAWIDAVSSLQLEYPSNGVALDYTVRDLNGTKIDAVATFTSANEDIIQTENNWIKPVGCGETVVTIAYGGVELKVSVAVELGVQKAELNAFMHQDALQGVSTYEFTKFGNGNFRTPVALTNETVKGETPAYYFLKCSSVYMESGKNCQYFGLFMPCRSSKAEVQALQTEGYKYVYVKMYAELLSESTTELWIEFSMWTGGYNKRFYKDTGWIEVWLPIEKYIENYDNFATNKVEFLRTSCSNKEAYNLYVAPIYFVK